MRKERKWWTMERFYYELDGDEKVSMIEQAGSMKYFKVPPILDS